MSCPELSNTDLAWHECIVLPGTLLRIASLFSPSATSRIWRQGSHRSKLHELDLGFLYVSRSVHLAHTISGQDKEVS